MTDEPDIRLQIRVKNARILRAMQAAGIATVNDLCRVLYGDTRMASNVGALVNFKARPINKDGTWRPLCVAIATALHREPDELWPEYLRHIEASKTETHIDITAEAFGAISNGEAAFIDRDMVRQMLKAIPLRAVKVLEMRFGLNGNGEHTYEEVGKAFGVTRERIRQIEIKALRRLKAPHMPHNRQPFENEEAA